MPELPDLVLNGKPMPVSVITNPVTEEQTLRRYVHSQMVASQSWDIEHGLGCYPSVSIVDTGGSVVIGEVQYVSNTRIIVNFSAVFSGKAYLN